MNAGANGSETRSRMPEAVNLQGLKSCACRCASFRQRESVKNNATLAGGIGLAAIAWVGLLTVLILRHQPIPWFSLAYNVPITLVFAGLVLHLASAGIRLGWTRFVKAYAPLGVVWVVGTGLLFLRLGMKSIDVSGHMAWSVMMGVQCIVQRLPVWFTAAVWAVAAQVILLKIFLLGGQSGQKGVAVGVLLGAAVWVATRGRKDVEFETHS